MDPLLVIAEAIVGHETHTGRRPQRVNVAPDMLPAIRDCVLKRCTYPVEYVDGIEIMGVPVVSSVHVLETDLAIGWAA